MKVGILIPCYNRPEYLKQTLWSLEKCDLSQVDTIMFIDDCSTNPETPKLIEQSKAVRFKDSYIHYHRNTTNQGIKATLLYGYEYLFNHGFDIVIKFDSDAIIKPNTITELLKHYFTAQILTGFHCTTKNSNGTDRHKIIIETPDRYLKQSVGGINFCIDKYAYEDYIKPALQMPGNWDHNACLNLWKTKNTEGVHCLKQSVVQHIGFDSSLNHTEQPDIADDFYYWDLPSVTLLGVDNQHDRLNRAKDICTKWIKFGEVVTLNPDIRSKEAYSQFMIKEAYKHINTSHALIFQHDGYVNNWMAWDNDWLQYDYIGAPWHYQDGMAVGNGGFSLRSRRLMEILATDPKISFTHPEDHHICRTYRPYLEATYGIKFAPLEVAERFSFEGYMQPNKVLKDQFGVHGFRRNTTPTNVVKQKYVFNQFLSLGDILFLIPMYRELINEGHSIIWPIDDKLMPITKHFKDVNFVPKSQYNLPYESRSRINTQHGVMLPYRFASENMGRTLRDCMRSKMELYGHNYLIWRNLYYERDYNSEQKLLQYLNLPEKFNLINRYFGHDFQHKISPIIENELPCVEMSNIEGFTLIDWLCVFEKAEECHIANSSIMYLLELMNMKKSVHVYPRKIWGENSYEFTSYLWTSKSFIFH